MPEATNENSQRRNTDLNKKKGQYLKIKELTLFRSNSSFDKLKILAFVMHIPQKVRYFSNIC